MTTESSSWAERDYERLENLVKRGLTTVEISDKLGRGFNNVKAARSRLHKSRSKNASSVKMKRVGAATFKKGAVASKDLQIDEHLPQILVGFGAGIPASELGSTTGLGESQVTSLLRRHEAHKHIPRVNVWRERFERLKKDTERVKEGTDVEKVLMAELATFAPKSYQVHGKTPTMPKDSKGTEACVSMVSDLHFGADVNLVESGGLEEYSPDICLDRLAHYEDKLILLQSITESRKDEIVINLLGDLLHGALSHSAEADQKVTTYAQWHILSHALAQFVRNLAQHFPKVRVLSVPGNHGRFAHQRKSPTKNADSNLDNFVAQSVKALTRDIPNIKWLPIQGLETSYEVKGKVIHAMHGHFLRGGDKALGLPVHAIGRMVSAKAQAAHKMGKKAPSIYLMGHFHRSISLPHSLGKILVNGAMIGTDGYAVAENFQLSDPIQHVFFMHEEHGMTASYDVYLKPAKKGLGDRYMKNITF